MPEIVKISAMTLFAISSGLIIAAIIFNLAPSLPLYFQVIPAFCFGALLTIQIANWMDNNE